MMKRFAYLLLLGVMLAVGAKAQRFALIDTEYILKRIPAYTQATQQLDNQSKQWQAEVESMTNQAKSLYENYQSNAKNLTEAQRKQKEDAIVAKEKEANELRRKYFGPEGELYKQRESLLSPIQDKLYEAVKAISTQKGISLVLDRASDSAILFASPSIDISDEVLSRLGVAN
jgi:outer membrane protein